LARLTHEPAIIINETVAICSLTASRYLFLIGRILAYRCLDKRRKPIQAKRLHRTLELNI